MLRLPFVSWLLNQSALIFIGFALRSAVFQDQDALLRYRWSVGRRHAYSVLLSKSLCSVLMRTELFKGDSNSAESSAMKNPQLALFWKLHLRALPVSILGLVLGDVRMFGHGGILCCWCCRHMSPDLSITNPHSFILGLSRIRGFEKGWAGRGWRPTAPKIQQKLSPRIVFSYS